MNANTLTPENSYDLDYENDDDLQSLLDETGISVKLDKIPILR